MTVTVTALLLLAALIHASWNAFIKGARDPVAMAAVIYGSEAMLMMPALFYVGPLPESVWLLMAVHVLLHIIYKIALVSMYIHGDLMYQSSYVSGLRIVDVSDPENPKEVAYFDTVPYDESPGFNGSWSNYPFFESGTIVVTSGKEGVFFLKKREPLTP